MTNIRIMYSFFFSKPNTDVNEILLSSLHDSVDPNQCESVWTSQAQIVFTRRAVDLDPQRCCV